MVTTEAGAEMPVHGKHGKTMKLFSHPSHRPWKSIKPISTFPHHDYDEDEYFLKPAGLRDTHSEGKVIFGISAVYFGAMAARDWHESYVAMKGILKETVDITIREGSPPK